MIERTSTTVSTRTAAAYWRAGYLHVPFDPPAVALGKARAMEDGPGSRILTCAEMVVEAGRKLGLDDPHVYATRQRGAYCASIELRYTAFHRRGPEDEVDEWMKRSVVHLIDAHRPGRPATDAVGYVDVAPRAPWWGEKASVKIQNLDDPYEIGGHVEALATWLRDPRPSISTWEMGAPRAGKSRP